MSNEKPAPPSHICNDGVCEVCGRTVLASTGNAPAPPAPPCLMCGHAMHPRFCEADACIPGRTDSVACGCQFVAEGWALGAKKRCDAPAPPAPRSKLKDLIYEKHRLENENARLRAEIARLNEAGENLHALYRETLDMGGNAIESLTRRANELEASLDKAEAERDAAIEGNTRRDEWIVKLNDENDELKARAERLADTLRKMRWF